MGFKVFIYLSLLVAVALHISSDVAARDLVETSVDNKKVNTNNKAFTNWWGASIYGGFPGQVSYGYPGQGDYGGYPSQGDYGGYPRYPGQGDYGGHPGYPGQGGYGGYPEYPGQGGYGGNCYFGCCRLNYYGLGCERCCNYFGEPLDAETEARPHN